MAGWILDLVIIGAYFALILGVGLYMGRKEDSLSDFALGGRRIPWWAVLASIVAAETSAGTFIGTPGEGYAHRNFTYLQLALGTIIARIVIAFTFLKPYYDYNVYSIYEFLKARFGPQSRNAASAVFLVTRVLASGTRLYIAAVILVLACELLMGARPDRTQELLIYVGAITAVTLLTAIYTTLGGIKAVIWTDMIQATVMMGSAIVAIALLFAGIPGGWAEIGRRLASPGDLRFLDAGIAPALSWWDNAKAILGSEYTIWAGILGSTFTTMATHGTDQDMVQRMLTAKDVRRSRLSLVLSGLADIPIVLVFLTIGILLWVHFQTSPDPRLPAKTNEIFCYYILTGMPVGVRGLLTAGIFATAMGSLSAALNALATSFTRDWYHQFIRPGATETDSLRAAKIATAVFALLMIIVASGTAAFVIINPKSRIIPIALGIFGYTYGSLLGVFLVGMLTRTRGNDFGNLIAMVAGFAIVALMSGLPNDIAAIFGTTLYPQPDWLPRLEFPWRILFGSLGTAAVALCFRTAPARPAPSP
ncbi:MAG TPA: sodium:solute symporter [Verrucomicrobiae bacterium]|nr:sodium:solute symporter [Verrucomicrobiae bacterium]